MSRPKVVVAEAIAKAAVERLEKWCDVEVVVGAERDELIAALGDAVALVVRSATLVDAEMIAAAPMLEVIGRAGVGLDNIDVEAATSRGIAVVNAPDASTISAAEHTMALLLAQARRIPEADASLRAGRWERSRLQGVELYGKTLGIVGLGRIGAHVAQRARAFGMRVVAFDPVVGPEQAEEIGVELTGFDDVLAEADFLTIHAPRSAETEGLIDREALAKMKPTARIINVARGGILDEEALAGAIADGTIAGAAIDVFAAEPTTASPLFDFPQVVVTPHLGASTHEAQQRAGASVVDAVIDALGAS
jgi:D-3-phosphoglycerate dehydrogenase